MPNPANADQLEAIKAKLDDWLGLPSEMKQWEGDPEHHVELQYKSPKGILMFNLSLHWYRGVWHHASRSLALPVDVDQIRLMIEPLQPAEQALDAVFQGN